MCDDRPAFANEERFPDAAQVLCDSFENCIRQLKITSYDYIVIITRGHTHDADCLREIFKGTQPAYLGLIGSRGDAPCRRLPEGIHGQNKHPHRP